MKPTGADVWFDRFLGEHLKRHPRGAMPPRETKGADGKTVTNPDFLVVYESWLKILRRNPSLDYAALTEASERLIVEPASDRRHFSSLIAFAKEALLHRHPEGKRHDLGTREGAEAASKNCDRCGGCGLTSVFHPLPLPDRTPRSVGAHCVCAHGRWIRAWFAGKNDHDTLRRMVDLDDVIQGRCKWLPYDPSLSEEAQHIIMEELRRVPRNERAF